MKIRGDTWVGIWSVLCMILFVIAFGQHWIEAMDTIQRLIVGVLGGYVAYTTITKGIKSFKGPDEE